MKKMLMLGSASNSVEMINYAKSLGIYTITTDNRLPEHSPAKLVCDEYWQISTADVDELERKCREEGVTAITEGKNDFNREIMMALTQRLNLPCYITPESCLYERDKELFKRTCREVGALVPEDFAVSSALTQEELKAVRYPVIVKPVDQTGNCGVSYCYGPDDVRKAYAEVRRVSDSPKTIIEQMLHGLEYVAYYALAEGEAKFLDIVVSYGIEGKPKNCYVINTTQCEMAKWYTAQWDEKTKAFLKRIGCREGYAWIQLMQESMDGPMHLIEMGYRLSGEKMHMTFPERHGFNAVHWLTNCALGIPNDLSTIDREPPARRWGMTYVLWLDKGGTVSEVRGMEALAAYPGIHISNMVIPGRYYNQYAYPIVLGYSYDTVEELVDMVKYVNDHVALLDENGENMLMYYTDYDFLRRELGKGESA